MHNMASRLKVRAFSGCFSCVRNLACIHQRKRDTAVISEKKHVRKQTSVYSSLFACSMKSFLQILITGSAVIISSNTVTGGSKRQ